MISPQSSMAGSMYSQDRQASRRLKVLQIGKYYPPYRGGMETHLETLCQRLKPYVDLDVVVANSNREFVQEIVDGVPVTRLPLRWSLRSAPICPELVSLIRKSDADIIHIHHPNPFAMLAWALSGSKAKLVITYHSDIVRQKFTWPLFRPLCDYTMRSASAILATSQNYVAHSSMLAKHRHRSHVVPLGMSTEQIDRKQIDQDCSPAALAIRKQYKRPVVLAVGRLVYYKGFEYLVRAMKSVDADLLLIGTGPLDAHLRELAKSLSVQDRVHFVGEVPDVTAYYQACDVFVLPSIAPSEAFGLVQLEAMASRRPVINTCLPTGVPYVSPHLLTGLTVPPCNAEALSSAINTLLNDVELRSKLGRRGRERVMAEFSDKVMADRTIDIYCKVTGAEIPVMETPAPAVFAAEQKVLVSS